MRNITRIGISKPGKNPQRVGAIDGKVAVRYDLPVGVRNIYFGTLQQTLPVPTQTFTASLLRLLLAHIQQTLPVPTQTFGVHHFQVFLAHIIQELPVAQQALSAHHLRLLRASIKQTLPVPLQELADHYKAHITQNLPVPIQDPHHGNVILLDGTMLTALWQDLPVLEHLIQAAPPTPSYLKLGLLLVDRDPSLVTTGGLLHSGTLTSNTADLFAEMGRQSTVQDDGGTNEVFSLFRDSDVVTLPFYSREIVPYETTPELVHYESQFVDAEIGSEVNAFIFSPPNVQNFQASPVAMTGDMVLTWTASSGATNYLIEWGTTSGGPYTDSVTVGAVTTYTVTGLTIGTVYYFRIAPQLVY